MRQAVANKVQLVGALNNDMIGWANDQHLDNTIRYSNPGIRDIQHAAAFLFTRLITYDALYFKSTDAAAYYDAYGDIVGGIGYLMRRFDFPTAPVIIGMILGPLAEQNFRQAMTISQGDLSAFLTRPLSLTLLIMATAALLGPHLYRLARR